MPLKKYILLAAGGLLLALLLYKPVKRFAMTPLKVHASWVEPLRRGKWSRWEELKIYDGKTARENYGDKEVDAIEQVNEQKRRLFATYQSGRGKMGLSKRYGTVEGDPIFTWLLVEDGGARFIKDCTQDPWGSAAGVATRTVKLRLGFFREGKFVEGEPAATDSPIIVLEMATPGSGRNYFH